jgi:hypothetical protein
MEFMPHVPGVAVHHDDKGLGESLPSPERIELTLTQCESLSGLRKRGKGLDVVPAGEGLAVATI